MDEQDLQRNFADYDRQEQWEEKSEEKNGRNINSETPDKQEMTKQEDKEKPGKAKRRRREKDAPWFIPSRS